MYCVIYHPLRHDPINGITELSGVMWHLTRGGRGEGGGGGVRGVLQAGPAQNTFPVIRKLNRNNKLIIPIYDKHTEVKYIFLQPFCAWPKLMRTN